MTLSYTAGHQPLLTTCLQVLAGMMAATVLICSNSDWLLFLCFYVQRVFVFTVRDAHVTDRSQCGG